MFVWNAHVRPLHKRQKRKRVSFAQGTKVHDGLLPAANVYDKLVTLLATHPAACLSALDLGAYIDAHIEPETLSLQDALALLVQVKDCIRDLIARLNGRVRDTVLAPTEDEAVDSTGAAPAAASKEDVSMRTQSVCDMEEIDEGGDGVDVHASGLHHSDLDDLCSSPPLPLRAHDIAKSAGMETVGSQAFAVSETLESSTRHSDFSGRMCSSTGSSSGESRDMSANATLRRAQVHAALALQHMHVVPILPAGGGKCARVSAEILPRITRVLGPLTHTIHCVQRSLAETAASSELPTNCSS